MVLRVSKLVTVCFSVIRFSGICGWFCRNFSCGTSQCSNVYVFEGFANGMSVWKYRNIRRLLFLKILNASASLVLILISKRVWNWFFTSSFFVDEGLVKVKGLEDGRTRATRVYQRRVVFFDGSCET